MGSMNMSKVSNSYLGVVVKLLILLAVAKAISLALWWYLPDDGVTLKENINFNPAYHRIDFKNMLSSSVASSQVVRNETKKVQSVGITSMILKGLYGTKERGFIIVALKSSAKKTSIVSVGEEYAGYKLKSILKDGALFTKGGKEYVLKIATSKRRSNARSSITPVSGGDGASVHSVSRRDIKYYEKNPDQIWKDISIMEIKRGNRINGFKVTRVRRGSKMARLGLKRGDVIIRANNVELNSYKSAFDLYKQINTIDTLQLVVRRNNEEKELVYEIH